MIIKSHHLPSDSKHKIRKRKKCLWHTNAEYNLFLKPFSCMHTHSRSPLKMKLQNLLITKHISDHPNDIAHLGYPYTQK